MRRVLWLITIVAITESCFKPEIVRPVGSSANPLLSLSSANIQTKRWGTLPIPFTIAAAQSQSVVVKVYYENPVGVTADVDYHNTPYSLTIPAGSKTGRAYLSLVSDGREYARGAGTLTVRLSPQVSGYTDTTVTITFPASSSGANVASGFQNITAGPGDYTDFHVCGLTTSGGVQCWGAGNTGQMGDGTNTARSYPADVSGLGAGSNIIAIAAGQAHTCALNSTGTVKCWGSNSNGQIGNGVTGGSYNTPQAVALANVTQITAGEIHTCAYVSSADKMYCWGGNLYGQLGDGTNGDKNSPTYITTLSNILSIGAGALHTCAVLNTGAGQCWGYNGNGGLGDTTTMNKNAPVAVSGLANATQITGGKFHTCAVTTSNTVYCWGDNTYGDVGDGTGTQRTSATLVPGLTNISKVAAGLWTSFGITTTGDLYAWGINFYGQLGDGTSTNQMSPIKVSSGFGSTVTNVASSMYYTCATLANTTALCVGTNGSGQAGNAISSAVVPTPVDVNGSFVFSDIFGGIYPSGLTTAGEMRTWGWRRFPTVVPGLATGVSMINNYNGTALLLTTAGAVYTVTSLAPVATGLAGVSYVATGYDHFCIIQSGTVKCWGDNTSGEVGNGVTGGSYAVGAIQTVAGITNAVALSLGYRYSCALLADQTVSCWGAGVLGQLGNGVMADTNTPSAVASLSGIAQITSQDSTTCARTNSGALYCWGDNTLNKVGSGLATSANPYLTLPSGSVTDVAVGYRVSCAVTVAGSLKCWGSGGQGPFGDGTTGNYVYPTDISTLQGGVVKLATQPADGNCVLIANGRIKCWGRGDSQMIESTLGMTPKWVQVRSGP